MTDSAAILRYLEAALAPLVQANGGECLVAADEDTAIGMLAMAPRAWRVVLQYDGRGEQESARLAISPWRFVVWVQAAKGLPVKPGNDVHQARAGGAPPMLDLVDAVDGWTRALDFSQVPGVQCPGARSTGGAWVSLESDRARQHRLSFELLAELPVFPRFSPPTAG
jgi:hypothetical protein